MTEAEKKVRAYLGEIGRRGGNHQPSRTDQIARKTDGRDPRNETGHGKGPYPDME
jgi:hypothetical protein